jgi:hypothetical protein
LKKLNPKDHNSGKMFITNSTMIAGAISKGPRFFGDVIRAQSPLFVWCFFAATSVMIYYSAGAVDGS